MIFTDIPAVLAQSGGQPSPTNQPGQTQQGQGQGQGQQGTTQAPQGQQGQQQQQAPPGPDFTTMLLILGLVVLGLWAFTAMGQRKEKKKREQMEQSLKKGAKVQTAGGILGTVVEVRNDEVVVKVDENANTRMRFTRSAIKSVSESEEEAKSES
jgi:preprotein translocase subunit YajC